MNHELGRVERLTQKQKSTRRLVFKVLLAVVALILCISAYVAYSPKHMREVVADLDQYSKSAKPDARLVADFVVCLKDRSGLSRMQPVECADTLSDKHGPDAICRVDKIIKTLARPS
jgi:hypothetical protein